MIAPLSLAEVAHALKLGLFTVTSETPRGYVVSLFRKAGKTLVRVGRSRECVRPATARRYGEALVRRAIEDFGSKAVGS